MTDAFVQISRQEGVKALYSGYDSSSFSLVIHIMTVIANKYYDKLIFLLIRIWPAVLRQATYGTIKFGTYYTLKKFALERGHLIDKNGNERVWCNVICAVIGI